MGLTAPSSLFSALCYHIYYNPCLIEDDAELHKHYHQWGCNSFMVQIEQILDIEVTFTLADEGMGHFLSSVATHGQATHNENVDT